MRDADRRRRALRKLERLVSQPLGGVKPRVYQALGIAGLDRQLAGNTDDAGWDPSPAEQRMAGGPLRETTARVRRELGL